MRSYAQHVQTKTLIRRHFTSSRTSVPLICTYQLSMHNCKKVIIFAQIHWGCIGRPRSPQPSSPPDNLFFLFKIDKNKSLRPVLNQSLVLAVTKTSDQNLDLPKNNTNEFRGFFSK